MMRWRVLVIVTAICWPFAVSAETKGAVGGSVTDVGARVKPAFQKLKIQEAETTVTFVFAVSVGKAESGSRVVVP